MADDAAQQRYRERLDRIFSATGLAGGPVSAQPRASNQPNVVGPRPEPPPAPPAQPAHPLPPQHEVEPQPAPPAQPAHPLPPQHEVEPQPAPPAQPVQSVQPAGGGVDGGLGGGDGDGGDSDDGGGGDSDDGGGGGLCCCLSRRCCWLFFVVMASVAALLALAVLICSLLLATGDPHLPPQITPRPAGHTVAMRVPNQVPAFLSDAAISWSEVSRIQSWVRRPDSDLDRRLAKPVREMLDLVTVNGDKCYASDRAAEMYELGRLYLGVSANLTADVSAARTALDSFIWRVRGDRNRFWFLDSGEPCRSYRCLGIFLAKHFVQWRYEHSNKGAAAESVLRHIRWLNRFVTDQKRIHSASFDAFMNVAFAVDGAATEICAASWRMRTWQRESQNLDLWWAAERQANREELSLEGAGAMTKLACDNGLRHAAEAVRFGKGKLEQLAALYVVMAGEAESLAQDMSLIRSDNGVAPVILDLLLSHAGDLRDAQD